MKCYAKYSSLTHQIESLILEIDKKPTKNEHTGLSSDPLSSVITHKKKKLPYQGVPKYTVPNTEGVWDRVMRQ